MIINSKKRTIKIRNKKLKIKTVTEKMRTAICGEMDLMFGFYSPLLDIFPDDDDKP